MTEDTIHPFDVELLQLISDLEGRLGPKVIFHAREDLKYGEYQMCLEGIICGLEDIDRPIPADILNRLIEYSAAVHLGENACKDLRPE
ncbi:hypothetical protein [Rathayibacter toxicus]|uniref:MafI family immunity protein n=1 Tax=Rathayibacter toxicus TaxID=145458 RepID=A0A0C5BEB0_9MICO|nr:hypothetical protein [Rathayibacter toxicus]AJM77364.1 hypothetical protein TI83_04175 [Rathayibacter toxicus]ALS56750.1 hypothetical protein APU90_02295 [Rathayibacter toxicus]KKM46729.1 hypothetical protein VT73_02220 [Rathayibacter toxicus]PPG22577.1 hypothetical protein C5D15_03975 [Rathayibacter toxicus]PPG44549.1 hypothetical protein C5D16_10680 [Rathayibacter toxicus]